MYMYASGARASVSTRGGSVIREEVGMKNILSKIDELARYHNEVSRIWSGPRTSSSA